MSFWTDLISALSFSYYIIYFLGLPIILIYFYRRIKSHKSYINFFDSLDKDFKDQESNLDRKKQEERKASKTKIIFIVILVVFIFSWHFTASEVADQSMKRELKFGAGGMYFKNPVVVSLGPTYNVDEALNTMENKENIWLPKKINEVVDLEKLTKNKGRIAVYRTYDERYLLTYTYLSPYPIIKVYGFQYLKKENGEIKIIRKDQKTIYYPMNPGGIGDTAKLID